MTKTINPAAVALDRELDKQADLISRIEEAVSNLPMNPQWDTVGNAIGANRSLAAALHDLTEAGTRAATEARTGGTK